ncbi:MAG TPA: hypothetical protein VN822_06020 [Candidatus Acidoferrales bacterium]|nr:hypothetical protein [Candidatus Acidoferrales bacterium]
MPIISKVDHERHEIQAIAVGPVGYSDVEDHILQQRRSVSLSYREFLDGRGAGPRFSPAEVRQIVELLRNLSRESPLGRTAVLVSSDYAFGLMRMFEMLLEDVFEFRVFRDEREAHAWLAGNAARGQST